MANSIPDDSVYLDGNELTQLYRERFTDDELAFKRSMRPSGQYRVTRRKVVGGVSVRRRPRSGSLAVGLIILAVRKGEVTSAASAL